MCRSSSSSSSSSSSHFLFQRDFLGTIADTDIINTPPEPFRPTDVLLGVTNPKLKIYEIFRFKDLGRKSISGCSLANEN